MKAEKEIAKLQNEIKGYISLGNDTIVFDFQDQYPRAVSNISNWLDSGAMKTKEHIVPGLNHFTSTLKMLFTGDNFGKLLVKVN